MGRMKNFKRVVFGILMMFMVMLTVNAEQKNVATETELKTALTTVADGDVINIENDIETSSIIVISGSGKVTINGNGNEISTTARKAFEIKAYDGALDITFDNIIISNDVAAGRAIDTRTDDITLNIKNSEIITTGSNSQPITIGGYDTGGVNLNITNATSTNSGDAGYTIIAFVPVDINVEDSTLEGWTALYFKPGSAGSTAIIKNSVINSVNKSDGESNNFSALTFNETNVDVELIGTEITAKSEADTKEYLISTGYLESSGTINVYIKDGSSITLDSKDEYVHNYTGANAEGAEAQVNLVIGSNVTSNVEIAEEYLADSVIVKKESGIYRVYKENEIRFAILENGDAKLNKDYAIKGEEVTIKLEPKEGFELDKISATTNGNVKITLTKVSDTEYKFTMLDDEVAFVVKFTPIQTAEMPVVGDKNEVGVKDTSKTEEVLLETLNSSTDKKITEILKDTSVKVEVEVEDVKATESVTTDFEKALTDNKIKGAKLINFFDITVSVKNAKTDKEITTLPELSKAIELMVKIPKMDEVKEGYVREYYIIREHNGKIELIKDVTLSKDGKYLTFESSKFSTYALAYVDKVIPTTTIPETPKTSDNVLVYVTLGLISIGGIILSLNELKKRRFN